MAEPDHIEGVVPESLSLQERIDRDLPNVDALQQLLPEILSLSHNLVDHYIIKIFTRSACERHMNTFHYIWPLFRERAEIFESGVRKSALGIVLYYVIDFYYGLQKAFWGAMRTRAETLARPVADALPYARFPPESKGLFDRFLEKNYSIEQLMASMISMAQENLAYEIKLLAANLFKEKTENGYFECVCSVETSTSRQTFIAAYSQYPDADFIITLLPRVKDEHIEEMLSREECLEFLDMGLPPWARRLLLQRITILGPKEPTQSILIKAGGQQFCADKDVLCFWSSYFAASSRHDWADRECVDLQDHVNPAVMQSILDFMYCGEYVDQGAVYKQEFLTQL
ncbi:hypothetical protein BDW62DRAFT_200176 [Aspergillus aurantiobrunneus]